MPGYSGQPFMPKIKPHALEELEDHQRAPLDRGIPLHREYLELLAALKPEARLEWKMEKHVLDISEEDRRTIPCCPVEVSLHHRLPRIVMKHVDRGALTPRQNELLDHIVIAGNNHYDIGDKHDKELMSIMHLLDVATETYSILEQEFDNYQTNPTGAWPFGDETTYLESIIDYLKTRRYCVLRGHRDNRCRFKDFNLLIGKTLSRDASKKRRKRSANHDDMPRSEPDADSAELRDERPLRFGSGFRGWRQPGDETTYSTAAETSRLNGILEVLGATDKIRHSRRLQQNRHPDLYSQA